MMATIPHYHFFFCCNEKTLCSCYQNNQSMSRDPTHCRSLVHQAVPVVHSKIQEEIPIKKHGHNIESLVYSIKKNKKKTTTTTTSNTKIIQ